MRTGPGPTRPERESHSEHLGHPSALGPTLHRRRSGQDSPRSGSPLAPGGWASERPSLLPTAPPLRLLPRSRDQNSLLALPSAQSPVPEPPPPPGPPGTHAVRSTRYLQRRSGSVRLRGGGSSRSSGCRKLRSSTSAASCQLAKQAGPRRRISSAASWVSTSPPGLSTTTAGRRSTENRRPRSLRGGLVSAVGPRSVTPRELCLPPPGTY